MLLCREAAVPQLNPSLQLQLISIQDERVGKLEIKSQIFILTQLMPCDTELDNN